MVLVEVDCFLCSIINVYLCSCKFHENIEHRKFLKKFIVCLVVFFCHKTEKLNLFVTKLILFLLEVENEILRILLKYYQKFCQKLRYKTVKPFYYHIHFFLTLYTNPYSKDQTSSLKRSRDRLTVNKSRHNDIDSLSISCFYIDCSDLYLYFSKIPSI